MSEPSKESLTEMLQAAGRGDKDASARLLPLVYAELLRLARARMARLPPGQTLQPTALVHETYLRVLGKDPPSFENRRHFFFVAARAMRDILVERARRRQCEKRGGDQVRVDDDAGELLIEPPHEDMLDLDRALTRLEHEAPERAQVVYLRFFTGLSHEETAEILGVSVPTVERRWRYARAWLRRELARAAPQRRAD